MFCAGSNVRMTYCCAAAQLFSAPAYKSICLSDKPPGRDSRKSV